MFYYLSDKRSLSMLFASADPSLEDKLFDLTRGYTELATSPIIFTKDKKFGNRITDILNPGLVGPFVVRRWVRDLMQENGITGWREYPVRVVDLDGNDIDEYCGIGITGRCEGLDISKLWTCTRADGFVEYYGVDIDASTWDGSDLFMFPDTMLKFASQKVKSLFDKYKVTNRYFYSPTEWRFFHMEEITELLPGHMTETIPDESMF